jgi:hypothetical protein
MITETTLMEDLIGECPEAVGYLVTKSVTCLVCGEPIWGTLREAAEKSGTTGDALAKLVRDLNDLCEKAKR